MNDSEEAFQPRTDVAVPGIAGGSEPLVIRIGVTGHREFVEDSGLEGSAKERLEDFSESRIRRRVRAVLLKLDSILVNTPHRYEVLSPLAEGGDQIIADEILKWEGPRFRRSFPVILEVLMPMPEKCYLADFETRGGRKGFHDLLNEATKPLEEPLVKDCATQDDRRLAYERAGKQVASKCHILIAAWDGEETVEVAGTAATVKEARRLDKPVFHLVCPRHPGQWFKVSSYADSVIQFFETMLFSVFASTLFSVRWLRLFGIRILDWPARIFVPNDGRQSTSQLLAVKLVLA